MAGLFAFGALVIVVFGGRLGGEAGRAELWRYYLSTLAIVVALLLPVAIHPALFAVCLTLAALRIAVEIAASCALPLTPAARLSFAALAGLVIFAAGEPALADPLAALLLLLALVATPAYVQAMRAPLRDRRRWLLVGAFPLLATAQLSGLAHRPDGFYWILLLYASVEMHDSMALLFGRLFGRRLILPRLSPRKTVAGSIAGLIGGLATGIVVARFILERGWPASLALAAVVVLAGIAGDLFTSALKRSEGIKDYPAVYRLHGGLLDIYDSTLFAGMTLGFLLLAAERLR